MTTLPMKTTIVILTLVVGLFAAKGTVDQNYSGLSDVFEFLYFGQSAEPYGDPDGDDVVTWDEMIWGTSPTNAHSYIAAPMIVQSGTSVVLTWPSAPQYRSYVLQGSTNLVTWQPLAVSPTATFTQSLSAAGAARWRFYRLQATLDQTDKDGNGLADWEEQLWQEIVGLPPSATDVDADHLSDLEELKLGRDPGKKDHPAVGLILFTPLEK